MKLSTSYCVKLSTAKRDCVSFLFKFFEYFMVIISVVLKHPTIRSYMAFFLLGTLTIQKFLWPFERADIYLASSKRGKSILAPLNKHNTFFPLIRFLILSNPATLKAPEGYDIIPCEYSFNILLAIIFYPTETKPSIDVFPISYAKVPTDFTEEPLQKLELFQHSTTLPLIMEL